MCTKPQDGLAAANFSTANMPADQDNSRQALPPLLRDRAFLGMTATQFFGAFNDNLFKQLMLLLAVPVAGAAAGARDQQGLAQVVFALPFIIFSGFAGYLSDRFRKRDIIVGSKWAEIAIMLFGMLAFLAFRAFGYNGLLVVLFLMGTQSAFFGPGKYGILPEMLRERDLPRANGVILMTTFLAIIFGTALAGLLNDFFVDENQPLENSASRLAYGSAMCVGIAVLGTVTSSFIRPGPPAKPDLVFTKSSLLVPSDTRRVLADDRPLLMALLVSCMFWLVSGIAIPAVNSLGKVQLPLDPQWRDTLTSLMTAAIGLGIAAGAVIAGRISRGKADFRLTRFGAWESSRACCCWRSRVPVGFICLVSQAACRYWPCWKCSAGFFAIPLQVFIQSRPPDDQKGRMIAVMNLTNFVAILLSGVLYWLFDRGVDHFGAPRSTIFGLMALLILPVAFLYRPPQT